jgi:hypothetical protein
MVHHEDHSGGHFNCSVEKNGVFYLHDDLKCFQEPVELDLSTPDVIDELYLYVAVKE